MIEEKVILSKNELRELLMESWMNGSNAMDVIDDSNLIENERIKYVDMKIVMLFGGCITGISKGQNAIKINWKKIFDGINIDWLTKDEFEMHTSPCVLMVEREKVEKILNERLKEQLEQG